MKIIEVGGACDYLTNCRLSKTAPINHCCCDERLRRRNHKSAHLYSPTQKLWLVVVDSAPSMKKSFCNTTHVGNYVILHSSQEKLQNFV